MPKDKSKQRNQEQLAEIARLKEQYLFYYGQLPLQKLAAGFIGRDEDTIINWRKADTKFADAVTKAKSDWALSKVRHTRDTRFLLERIMKEDFAQKVEVQSNQPTSISFTYVLPSDQHQSDPEATPDVAEAPGPDDH
jgi:hypothetical protein